ncbi:MAG: hypothetical protein GXO58_01420 [Thermodesulfobacteria bacterium]|nr:hypothetical protein [Thermodesulfobacteriota bacterium]
MGEIKSALEIALEKAERLGSLSKEELEAQKWEDEGRKKAAAFLRGDIDTLQEALKDVDPSFIQTVLKGVTEVLLRNIVLPREKEQWESINKSFQGLREIKGSIAEQIVPQMEYLLKNYEQTIQNYKQQFQQQVQASLGAKAKGGMMAMTQEELSALASMQDEWNKISAEITSQFEKQLEPLKAYLK